MVSVRQRSANFFVRYAIVEADRQGVTGQGSVKHNEPAASTGFFCLYYQDAVNTLNIVRNAVSPQFGY